MREALGSSGAEFGLGWLKGFDLDLVKLARDRISTSHFSPQMVVKSKGNPRKFQGNLGEIL